MAKLEFYVDNSDKHIAVLNDGAVPRPLETVNIKGKDYTVIRVRWCVDWADDVLNTQLRAAIEISRRK